MEKSISMFITPRFAAAVGGGKLDGVFSVHKIDLLCGVTKCKKLT